MIGLCVCDDGTPSVRFTGSVCLKVAKFDSSKSAASVEVSSTALPMRLSAFSSSNALSRLFASLLLFTSSLNCPITAAVALAFIMMYAKPQEMTAKQIKAIMYGSALFKVLSVSEGEDIIIGTASVHWLPQSWQY